MLNWKKKEQGKKYFHLKSYECEVSRYITSDVLHDCVRTIKTCTYTNNKYFSICTWTQFSSVLESSPFFFPLHSGHISRSSLPAGTSAHLTPQEEYLAHSDRRKLLIIFQYGLFSEQQLLREVRAKDGGLHLGAGEEVSPQGRFCWFILPETPSSKDPVLKRWSVCLHFYSWTV